MLSGRRTFHHTSVPGVVGPGVVVVVGAGVDLPTSFFPVRSNNCTIGLKNFTGTACRAFVRAIFL